VEWRAFELHPGVPPEGQELPSRYRGTGGKSSFQLLAEEAGLEVGVRTHWYDSTPAHEAAKWAEAQGQADALRHAIFRAYFVHDQNIGSADVLVGLAEEVGLDGADLRAALAEGRYRDLVQQQYQESRSTGVTAVPTFVVDRYALEGAHPYEHFHQLMATVEAPRIGDSI
jgi:predicted DsbA family dithiol-disulfide isomerase